MFVLENRIDAKLSEANFHTTLCHLNQLLKDIHPMMLATCFFTDEIIFTVTMLKKPRRMTHRTHVHQPRRKTSWQNACAHNVRSVTVSISRRVTITVVEITPVWHLLITKSRLLRSINRNVMLLQQFLPSTRQISSEFFIFQQDSARHTGRLRQSTFPS